MADTEKNEDQKISRCLQEAFGYTDEQLLKQLDQANETLKDVTFDGAEDRIMKKIMARKAELEKETSAPEPETERNITPNKGTEESKVQTITKIMSTKDDMDSKNEKKVIRFEKKKILATVALVAAIVGMLGGTAVGRKNYFFKESSKEGYTVLLDNDKNKQENSKAEEAYQQMEHSLDFPILKLGYAPENMEFYKADIYKEWACIQFKYEDTIMNIIQMKNNKNASVNYQSDRKKDKYIFNKWINNNIEYSTNNLENGQVEYSAMLTQNNAVYYISSCMPENEYVRILENLNFY